MGQSWGANPLHLRYPVLVLEGEEEVLMGSPLEPGLRLFRIGQDYEPTLARDVAVEDGWRAVEASGAQWGSSAILIL